MSKYKIGLVSIFGILLLNSLSVFAKSKNNLSEFILKHPDYLVFAVPSQFDRLDPTLSMNAQTKNALQLIFEPLVKINNKQEIEPALAKDWVIKKNVIVMHLQENHFFSDGSKVTAYNVVDSFNRMCGSKSESISDVNGLVGCNRKIPPQIKIIDNYHFEMNVSVNPSLFLFQLTSPRVVITKENSNGIVGSGPYQLENSTHDYLILKKSSQYWNSDVVKNAGLILFRLQEKEINKWISQNHLDGTIMYSISSIMQFNKQNYILVNEPPMTTEILVFNNQRFPFNHQIVRQAIMSEIYNRNNISHCMKNVYRAYGVVPSGIGGSIADTLPQVMPEISPIKVFKEVPGLKSHIISVKIHRHNALKNSCEENELIEAAKKYHIRVNFKYHENYTSLWPLYLNHHLDGFVEFFDIKSREAYSIFQVFMMNSPENYPNVHDKRLDIMIEEAVSSFSHDRFQQYKKISQYLQNEAYVIPYYYLGHSNILDKCLVGISNSFYFNPYQYLPKIYKQTNCIN